MLAHWSIAPPFDYLAVAYVVVSAVLYVLGGRARGGRGTRAGGSAWRHEPLRTASFFAGLAMIVIALDSPIDYYAESLLWVHMVQHILLLTAAPPLILLGHPWPRMWRALPLRARTAVGRAIAGSPLTAPVRAVARPVPAFILFNATVLGWHVPAAYDATLSSNAVHQLEHAMFFFTGMLFWARVVDPGPLRPRLVWPVRIAYVMGAMVVGWVLALVLVLEPHALYSHYAALTHRPGGISAIGDQQVAGGTMWVLGSVSYSVTLLIGLYRWLGADSAAQQRPQAAVTT